MNDEERKCEGCRWEDFDCCNYFGVLIPEDGKCVLRPFAKVMSKVIVASALLGKIEEIKSNLQIKETDPQELKEELRRAQADLEYIEKELETLLIEKVRLENGID